MQSIIVRVSQIHSASQFQFQFRFQFLGWPAECKQPIIKLLVISFSFALCLSSAAAAALESASASATAADGDQRGARRRWLEKLCNCPGGRGRARPRQWPSKGARAKCVQLHCDRPRAAIGVATRRKEIGGPRIIIGSGPLVKLGAHTLRSERERTRREQVISAG